MTTKKTTSKDVKKKVETVETQVSESGTEQVSGAVADESPVLEKKPRITQRW